MVSDIRLLVVAEPFVPFTIHMTGGRQVHVPHLDHYDILSPDHMDHLTVDAEKPVAPKAG